MPVVRVIQAVLVFISITLKTKVVEKEIFKNSHFSFQQVFYNPGGIISVFTSSST